MTIHHPEALAQAVTGFAPRLAGVALTLLAFGCGPTQGRAPADAASDRGAGALTAACGGTYQDCCTTAPECGPHLVCDKTCINVPSCGGYCTDLYCGVPWASRGPGVCWYTYPPPTEPTGICETWELQCGIDCASSGWDGDPYCAWSGPGPADVSVASDCFSGDEVGPLSACPVGTVSGGGTRYACASMWYDPENCGECGHACPSGQSCSYGTCQ
jgi:hypothetical protein